tara:strand:+ start:1623 stop:2288 length:666 start_codon:yes stop_codon:yes gene_type:complete
MAHDFTDAGQVLTGASASTNPADIKLPEWGKPDFYLMHNPTSWEPVQMEDGEYEWLPILRPLILKAGVNGVRQLRGGALDDSAARLNFMDRGWTILPRELGYIVRYPAKVGHSHYCRWDRPHVMGGQVFLRRDEDEFNAFRRELVTDGTISRPEPEALEMILERMGHRIDRNASQIHIPSVKAIVDKTEAKRAGAKKAAKKAAKKPTPRKRKPAAKAQPNV